MSNFIHLHVHSHYSLLDGLGKIPDLVARAKKYGMDSLALTDHGVMYGCVDFFKAAKRHNIKPIIGVDIESGKYDSIGQDITFKRAVARLVDINRERYGTEKLRVQLVHGYSPDGIELLKQKAMEKLDCFFEETLPVAPVLGAHTGPSLTGIISGPANLFSDLL